MLYSLHKILNVRGKCPIVIHIFTFMMTFISLCKAKCSNRILLLSEDISLIFLYCCSSSKNISLVYVHLIKSWLFLYERYFYKYIILGWGYLFFSVLWRFPSMVFWLIFLWHKNISAKVFSLYLCMNYLFPLCVQDFLFMAFNIMTSMCTCFSLYLFWLDLWSVVSNLGKFLAIISVNISSTLFFLQIC